jgi:hypothetical protein
MDHPMACYTDHFMFTKVQLSSTKSEGSDLIIINLIKLPGKTKICFEVSGPSSILDPTQNKK